MTRDKEKVAIHRSLREIGAADNVTLNCVNYHKLWWEKEPFLGVIERWEGLHFGAEVGETRGT